MDNTQRSNKNLLFNTINNNNNNFDNFTMQRGVGQEDLIRSSTAAAAAAAAATAATLSNAATTTTTTAFEYSFPTNEEDDDDDDDDTESNKSTPYYTPMDFIQSPFVFPSPRLTDVTENTTAAQVITSTNNTTTTPATSHSLLEQQQKQTVDNQSPRIFQYTSAATSATTATTGKISTAHHSAKHMEPSSPALQKKFRRFSLYERRSCSPQHLLLKNSSSSSVDSTVETDKENFKPKKTDECSSAGVGGPVYQQQPQQQHSGNNSPSMVIDEITGSPRILTTTEANMLQSGRLSYSPKLLASINNLNLSSPLNLISSAGYKNGNYFKFPEIDVQAVNDLNQQQEQQQQQQMANENLCNKDNQQQATTTAAATFLKRHKKGNLSPCPLAASNANQAKAFSFDSHNLNATTLHETADLIGTNANPSTSAILMKQNETKRNRKNKNNLTIKICNNCSTAGTLPPISPTPKPKTPTIKNTKEKALSLDSAPSAGERLITRHIPTELCNSYDELDSHLPENIRLTNRHHPHHISHERLRQNVANTRSTSLSQLALHANNAHNSAAKQSTASTASTATSSLLASKHNRRKMATSNDAASAAAEKKSVVILKQDDDIYCSPQQSYSNLQTPSSTSTCTSTPSSAHRTPYKHNPLHHNSNTNLKTLPEFLTLVEFSTPSSSQQSTNEHPFKQKSMDLPSSASSVTQARPPINSSSSTNLLQRRGSNHSLTLNLHGSCSNLLGSCRTGLSVSNYSLGSVTNSTQNLNSKSSCNLNLATSQTTQTSQTPVTVNSINNQGIKQILFRRRGSHSNHSLTLASLTATSCGNLNSFASQNSLNVMDRTHQLTTTTSTTTLPRPITNSSLATTPRRGLLERRGSNQSLTLNMSSSFGGIGSEKGILGNSSINLGDAAAKAVAEEIKPALLNANCAVHSHQRRFFSSESLNNRANGQFSDINQTHTRNANQVCFGSVSDLVPSDRESSNDLTRNESTESRRTQHFDFQETTVCTCTGVRNIMTKPLSPQTTSEEFKIYLANIQMLQNASNLLNQNDLIKLNYIFDNSYASSNSKAEQNIPILTMHHHHHHHSSNSSKDAETPPATLATNSEDCEINERYMEVVKAILQASKPDDEEQKKMFRSLHKEFWDLPLNHQEKPMVFGSQTKNRYKTILPNENSRLIMAKESNLLLEMIQRIVDDETTEEEIMSELLGTHLLGTDEVPYINANYVKGPDYTSKCYIATQGPLPNTIYEFWLMCYQNTKKYIKITEGPDSPSRRQGKILKQYYQKIVMLTNFMENNRQKCSIYFPVDLNEIFITTPKEEVVQCTEVLNDFFNAYLNARNNEDEEVFDAPDNSQIISIETIRLSAAEVGEEKRQHLPNSCTFFVLKNVGIVRKNGFSIRKFIILYCANFLDTGLQCLLLNKFLCYHYWYPDWPDHRSPKDINTLVDISLHVMNLGKCESEFDVFSNDDCAITPPPSINAQHVELYQQDILNAVQPLPVIHCSAGIGRTGCLTAIFNGIRQVRQSLAYSLTSIAANSAKQATSSQALSPVDFCLPKQFLDQEEEAMYSSVASLACSNDMDCSFTRNTMLYIKFILQMEQQMMELQRQRDQANQEGMEKAGEQEEEDEEEEMEDDDDAEKIILKPISSLTELPKMPNIFVDILGIVCNLRLQRGGMVQNSEQYELIHRAICLYLKRTFALKRF